MNDRNLVRGLFLVAVALAFGLGAMRYPTGSFSRPGAGLFPLLVSALLLLVGLATIVRARLEPPLPLQFNPKNVGLVMLALCGLVAISRAFDMAAGITFMVFVASCAGRSPSWRRSLLVSAVLVGIAFAFQRLLGLNLPLF